MLLFVTALHVVLCLLLILIIILQPGKGGDVASAFGGGASSAVFGPRGGGNLLSRATTVVAVLFMVTSITLAMYSDESMVSSGSIEDQLLLQEIEEGSGVIEETQPSINNEPSDEDLLE